MEPCTALNVCSTVERHEEDIQVLWDEAFGEKTSNFIATGNIGGATDTDKAGNPAIYAIDTEEIAKGSLVINRREPAGLFIVGGMNFDQQHWLHYAQESKLLSPFTKLYLEKKLFPVMSEYDFQATTNSPGTIEEKMAETVLRIFPYLPDAKRYYSVYDDKSNTEFFVLSSGRRKQYYPDGPAAAFVFPNDPVLTQEQNQWLIQRCASTPAKNRVVIFDAPFASIIDVFRGVAADGANQVKTDFATWDFEALGIRLVITGHSGNSFHIRKGSTHIVNASAFLKSRMGLAISENGAAEPPVVTDTFGAQGYSIEYFSHRPMGVEYTGVKYPVADDNYITPKNEFFHMKCSRDGIVCEHISYDTDQTSVEGLINSQIVEHTFEISSL